MILRKCGYPSGSPEQPLPFLPNPVRITWYLPFPVHLGGLFSKILSGNSSLPSSKCIGRKKIVNNREKTGKKPGAQAGHPHHPRRPMEPDQVIEIAAEEKFKDSLRYVPTGNTISRQAIGISIVLVVTEYRIAEFYDRKKGRDVHSAFPCGVVDDVNYDGSMKALFFLLNSRCNVSLEKTAQFVHDVTDGALSPSVGMISGLCRELSSKSRQEQDRLFVALLDAPVMHVDGTVARVNGNNNNVVVCSNGAATMYFARESKGHAGIRDTPVETFGGILIHDHEVCFYSYGSDHQECMVHIERYLKDSIENEKGLTHLERADAGAHTGDDTREQQRPCGGDGGRKDRRIRGAVRFHRTDSSEGI